MSRIMLTMMVRNEEAVIERCLDAAGPFVDAASIVDTGSSDSTIDIIKAWANVHGVPTRVTTAPWTNFAENRDIAFERAVREAITLQWNPAESYALVLDADDVVHGEDRVQQTLTLPGYHVMTRLAGIEYKRLVLLRLNCPWHYTDVQHAIATGGGATGLVEGLWIESVPDGASWTAQTQEDKFLGDADRIMAAYRTEADPGLRARYEFYLGQSFKDAGQADMAISWYERRAANRDGYQDERCVAMVEAGRLYETLVHDHELSFRCFMKAVDLGPQRPEGWYHAAAWLRRRERYRLGYVFAEEAFRVGLDKDRPNVLFSETEAWTWGPVFEMSICGFYSPERARIEEGFGYAQFLASLETLPDNVRAQNLINLQAYADVHGLQGVTHLR